MRGVHRRRFAVQMADAVDGYADLPDARGHFGPYGGVFVAETLIQRARRAARRSTRAIAQRSGVHRRVPTTSSSTTSAGPRPIYHAQRWSRAARRRADLAEARRPEPHRRAQDQQRDRPGAARAAHGQAARDRRDRRRPARRRDRDRRARASAWNASSTWASEDVQRQAPNVYRMKLLGAKVVPVESGSKTLKDALNEAMRDWVTNVETRSTSSARSPARIRTR